MKDCDECGSIYDLVLIDLSCDLWWCQDCLDELEQDQKAWSREEIDIINEENRRIFGDDE